MREYFAGGSNPTGIFFSSSQGGEHNLGTKVLYVHGEE